MSIWVFVKMIHFSNINNPVLVKDDMGSFIQNSIRKNKGKLRLLLIPCGLGIIYCLILLGFDYGIFVV